MFHLKLPIDVDNYRLGKNKWKLSSFIDVI